jgi:hypothetical protein
LWKYGALVAAVAGPLLARLTLLALAVVAVHTITVYLLLLNYQAPLLSLLALAARAAFLTALVVMPEELLTLAYFFMVMAAARALVLLQVLQPKAAVAGAAFLQLALAVAEAQVA